jgi:hypothetical protein
MTVGALRGESLLLYGLHMGLGYSIFAGTFSGEPESQHIECSSRGLLSRWLHWVMLPDRPYHERQVHAWPSTNSVDPLIKTSWLNQPVLNMRLPDCQPAIALPLHNPGL